MKYSNSKLTFLNGIPDSDCHKFDMNHIVITGKPHSGKTHWAIRTLLDLVSTQPFPTERKKVLLHTGEHHILELVELMSSMLLGYGYPAFDSVSNDKLADLRYIQGYLGSILDFFKKYNYELLTSNDYDHLLKNIDAGGDIAFIVTDHYPELFRPMIKKLALDTSAIWVETNMLSLSAGDSRLCKHMAGSIPSLYISVTLNIDSGTASNDHYSLSQYSPRK